jgi:hypothetical protein
MGRPWLQYPNNAPQYQNDATLTEGVVPRFRGARALVSPIGRLFVSTRWAWSLG